MTACVSSRDRAASPAALSRPPSGLPRGDTSGDVIVLYSRPDGRFDREDEQFERLHLTFGDALGLERVAPEAAAGISGSWVSPSQVTFLVLREGDVLTLGIGELPFRELQDAIERAGQPNVITPETTGRH